MLFISLFQCESVARHGLPTRFHGLRTCKPSGHITDRVLHIRLHFQTPASSHSLWTALKHSEISWIIPESKTPAPLFRQVALSPLCWCPECFSDFHKAIGVQQMPTWGVKRRTGQPQTSGSLLSHSSVEMYCDYDFLLALHSSRDVGMEPLHVNCKMWCQLTLRKIYGTCLGVLIHAAT